MSRKAFLCVDVGSASLKGIIFSHPHTIHASFSIPLTHDVPNITERGISVAMQLAEQVSQAERTGAIEVTHFYAIVPPLYLSTFKKDFFLSLSTGYSPVVLTDLHRVRLFQLAGRGNFPWDYHLISVYPLEYYYDDHASSHFPVQQKAKRIGVKTEMIFVMKHFYSALEHMSSHWGISFSGLVPFFMGIEQLLEEHSGTTAGNVFFVDIGKRHTSVTQYIDGRFVQFQQLFIGGESVDSVIASTFGVSLSMAEEIKLNYGKLTLCESYKSKSINVKTEEGYRKINSYDFIQSVRQGYTGLLKPLRDLLSSLPNVSQVFFLGNTAQIEGFSEFLNETFTVHYGPPSSVIRDVYAALHGSVHYLCGKHSSEKQRVSPLFHFKELMKEYFSS